MDNWEYIAAAYVITAGVLGFYVALVNRRIGHLTRRAPPGETEQDQ